jgi:1-aminocyclopropane-1-carboxylate deaminase
MLLPDASKITVDKIDDRLLTSKPVHLDVLRLDKIHPVISGNKWFKLKYHLDNYNAGNYHGILTFGGAWSNHIAATAYTCYLKKINCIGIIRGEKPPRLSATLEQAKEHGMQLKFFSRENYRSRTADPATSTEKEYANFYTIPEGGAGDIGEKGAAEILDIAPGGNYTHIACAVGTGTMLNGIKKRISPDQEAIGIIVLKGWPTKTLQRSPSGSWGNENTTANEKLFSDYHFGGYAKYTIELLSFMNEFYKKTNIPTDFVYTGKLAFAIYDLIKKDQFAAGSKILMIHSGGLQGNASLQKGSLMLSD